MQFKNETNFSNQLISDELTVPYYCGSSNHVGYTSTLLLFF